MVRRTWREEKSDIGLHYTCYPDRRTSAGPIGMTPDKPGLYGWSGLGVLALTWGTAFAFISVAVDDLAPSLVAWGRLTLAALILTVWMIWRRKRLPALPDRRWLWILALGFFGNALPFTLISIGQQNVPSGIAGILMSMTPLGIVATAHFVVPNEKLTYWKSAGFLIGFTGILILTGPSAILGMLNASFFGQLLILIAALCYSANAILYQLAPETPPSVVASGSMICASILTLPLALFDILTGQAGSPSLEAIGAVIWLGFFPTALAVIVYVMIARQVGPTFIALVNYFVPIVATVTGVMLGEAIGLNGFIALGVILAGIFIARRKPRSASRSD